MQKILLDTNYRCGRYIVEASLNLISHNRERFDKKSLRQASQRRLLRLLILKTEETKISFLYAI